MNLLPESSQQYMNIARFPPFVCMAQTQESMVTARVPLLLLHALSIHTWMLHYIGDQIHVTVEASLPCTVTHSHLQPLGVQLASKKKKKPKQLESVCERMFFRKQAFEICLHWKIRGWFNCHLSCTLDLSRFRWWMVCWLSNTKISIPLFYPVSIRSSTVPVLHTHLCYAWCVKFWWISTSIHESGEDALPIKIG